MNVKLQKAYLKVEAWRYVDRVDATYVIVHVYDGGSLRVGQLPDGFAEHFGQVHVASHVESLLAATRGRVGVAVRHQTLVDDLKKKQLVRV